MNNLKEIFYLYLNICKLYIMDFDINFMLYYIRELGIFNCYYVFGLVCM